MSGNCISSGTHVPNALNRVFELNDSEIDVIRYSLGLLKKDCKFDLVTFSRSCNYDKISELVDTLSNIDFLLNKLHF